MLSPLSPENSPKSQSFSTMKQFFVENASDRYLLIGLSSFFSQNNQAFLKKIVTLLLYLSKIDKNIMFDCFGVMFVPLFSKKSQNFKMAKKART